MCGSVPCVDGVLVYLVLQCVELLLVLTEFVEVYLLLTECVVVVSGGQGVS